jgi:3',5'-cyclic AMP phosphodiesterase CpdA
MKSTDRFETSTPCAAEPSRRAENGPLRCAAGLLFTLLLTTTVASAQPCGGNRHDRGHKPPPPSPVPFAVISDPHLYDTHLGTRGAAFEAYLSQDPKLLRESEAILDAALDSIIQQHVRFVIIPGDLTKDGELVNHLLMAQHLAKLERHGIQAYVIPGNHDVNNPDAVSFHGDVTRPVATVNPHQFRAIYQRFGYNQAIARDCSSLSYVAEPTPGVWLLAIDSCKYDESKTNTHPVTSGRIRPETMTWIQDVMQQANARNKQVIAFMHHGVNQHFFGEADLFADWLLDDWATTSLQLAQTGLKVVFTGHYHSTDAAYLVDANHNPLSPLCDVETASLAAFPCAYRIATLDSEQLRLETQRVTAIQFNTGGVPFQQYAFNAVFAPTVEIATTRIMAMFGLPRAQAAAVAPLVAQAIIANYAGDETPSAETQALINGLISSPNEPDHTFGLILGGLWTDLPPADSNLVLPLGAN